MIAIALLSVTGLSAQYAPASIADTLVANSFTQSVFSGYDLIYFGADGTYQEIANQGVSDINKGFQTSPTTSGTYTYATTSAPSPTSTDDPRAITGLDGTVTLTNTAGVTQLKIGYPLTLVGGSIGVFQRVAVTGASNVSNNTWITSAHPTTPGFVIEGSSARWVLIRGCGPSLAQFSVANPVAAPSMTLFTQQRLDFTVNITVSSTTSANPINSWSADPNLVPGLKVIFSLAGAFPFANGSSDCAGLVLLQPGAYTVQGATPGADGELLTEIYVLPYSSL